MNLWNSLYGHLKGKVNRGWVKKSKHKAGEPFNDEWEYVGELRVPNICKDTFAAVGVGGKETGVVAKGYQKDYNNGLREILRHRKPSEKYMVGDVVELEGQSTDFLPDGEYRILTYRRPNIGDIIISGYSAMMCGRDVDDGIFCPKEVRWIVAPMALDWYDFDIVGVTCRAYATGSDVVVKSDSAVWTSTWRKKHSKSILDAILNAVDARLKSERGYGIVPVPFEVSQGNFEAPKQ